VRIAWFSPLPPTRSGVSAYTLELVQALNSLHAIDCFVDHPRGFSSVRALGLAQLSPARVFNAHDFVWMQQRNPYDLTVYQLGNAPCHDYMWAYLARYPGLVVLHDTGLHHARARHLLQQRRFDDYRAEFRFDHPDAARDVAEYAVEGLGGAIYYFWSMLGVVMRSARAVAVHNDWIAAGLRTGYPDAFLEPIRMGVPAVGATGNDRRATLRRRFQLPEGSVLFTAFGKVTAEKRIGAILRAIGALAAEGLNVCLLLVGDADEYPSLGRDVGRLGIGNRVQALGYVADELIGDYLAASDVALCLRWPTAGETSASWLRSLARSRPTVITDLAQLADVPTLDPRTWQSSLPGRTPVAVAIDLLDEDRSLTLAMRRLASDPALAANLATAGHEHWAAHHTLETMVSDYLGVMDRTAARPAPRAADLPAHFTKGYADLASHIAHQFGVDVDVLGQV
jgi:glycosyltransferase involved in cell wall biosynthesis